MAVYVPPFQTGFDGSSRAANNDSQYLARSAAVEKLPINIFPYAESRQNPIPEGLCLLQHHSGYLQQKLGDKALEIRVESTESQIESTKA